MKPDHRHELKANELAEWLTNFPQWTRKNSIYIILVLAAIIAAATFYIWRIHNKNVIARKQLELTGLAGQLLTGKKQIVQAQQQGKDISFILLQTAEGLQSLAQNTKDDQMAAFAFIKQAESFRTELHYRVENLPAQETTAQINRAKAGYTKALDRLAGSLVTAERAVAGEPAAAQRPVNPSLTAAAKFGIGLCEEDLGNFETAEQIYHDLATNPDFEGTVAAAQAKFRLETMDEYKQKLAFKPAPKTPVIEPAEPADTNTPDVNSSPVSPAPAPDDASRSSGPIAVPETGDINDINQSGK